jgi:type IV secretion system protein TrbL
MIRKPVLGLAGAFLAGLALTGCQNSQKRPYTPSGGGVPPAGAQVSGAGQQGTGVNMAGRGGSNVPNYYGNPSTGQAPLGSVDRGSVTPAGGGLSNSPSQYQPYNSSMGSGVSGGLPGGSGVSPNSSFNSRPSTGSLTPGAGQMNPPTTGGLTTSSGGGVQSPGFARDADGPRGTSSLSTDPTPPISPPTPPGRSTLYNDPGAGVPGSGTTPLPTPPNSTPAGGSIH